MGLTLGTRLKAIREEKGMTIEQLALKSGISAVEISSIEKGTRTPWMGTIKKLADALEVEFDELYETLQKEEN